MSPNMYSAMSRTMLLLLLSVRLSTGVDMFSLNRAFLDGSNSDADESEVSSSFNATSSFISHVGGHPRHPGHGRLTAPELRRLWRSAGCGAGHEIALRCADDPGDVIVVEEAAFYALPPAALNCSGGPIGPMRASDAADEPSRDALRRSFFPQLLGLPRMSRDLRQALNRRCSGLGSGLECRFNLELDHPESREWGSTGLIDVFYRCVPKQATNRHCDRSSHPVSASPRGDSRFLLSPVYPKYLVGGRRCRWTLRAEPGQRLQLRLLDVSLRERRDGDGGGGDAATTATCEDAVSVSERGKPLLRMCGELKEDVMLLSEGNTLDVKLETRKTDVKSIYPRRGILAEFWPVGCANQNQPSDGYLQFRNDSVAVYACSLGHVFLPDLERTRTITCQQDTRRWSGRLGSCYPFDYLRQYGNASILSLLETKYPGHSTSLGSSRRHESNDHLLLQRQPSLPAHSAASWFEEVVLPVLGVGAGVVLALAAAIVMLIVRRHLQMEREGHPIDEDRSALTPCSLRRGLGDPSATHLQYSPPPAPPPVLHFEINSAAANGNNHGTGRSNGSTTSTFVESFVGGGGSSSSNQQQQHELESRTREELFLC